MSDLYQEVPMDELCHCYQRAQVLLLRLFHAQDEFSGQCEDDGGRKAMLRALRAVTEFIDELSVPAVEGLSWPLWTLMNDLLLLEDGIVQPALRKKPSGRGGLKNRRSDAFKARVAAIVTIWMKAGRTEDEAANIIAVALGTARYKARGRQDIGQNTIKEWRKDVLRLPATEFQRERYDAVLADPHPAELGDKDRLSDRAEKMTARLIAMFPPHTMG